MSEEISLEDLDEPSDDDLVAGATTSGDELTDDEVIPAARKLPSFEAGGVGEAEEAMQEGANLTVSAKEAERKALEDAMQRFLAGGGKIQQVPSEVSARNKGDSSKGEGADD